MARSFDCPLCKWSGNPSFELTDAGVLRAKCGRDTCQFMDAQLGPADFNDGAAVTKAGKPIEPPAQLPIRPLARTAPPRASAAPQLVDPGDVIGMIRARRDYLEMEVAGLEAKKTELRKLNKMLAAAARIQAAAALDSDPATEH